MKNSKGVNNNNNNNDNNNNQEKDVSPELRIMQKHQYNVYRTTLKREKKD